MFEVIEYTPSLDLKPYFKQAYEEGFIFHTSPRVFHRPQEPVVNNWIVYQDNNPISTFGVHSLKKYNASGYSIMSKMCVLKYKLPNAPAPKAFYNQHQNFVAQIVLPTCINWLLKTQGSDISTYVSVDLDKPPQYMKGHNLMLQSWSKRGLIERIEDCQWDNRQVALWKWNYKEFLEQYSNCPKWDVHFPS